MYAHHPQGRELACFPIDDSERRRKRADNGADLVKFRAVSIWPNEVATNLSVECLSCDTEFRAARVKRFAAAVASARTRASDDVGQLRVCVHIMCKSRNVVWIHQPVTDYFAGQ